MIKHIIKTNNNNSLTIDGHLEITEDTAMEFSGFLSILKILGENEMYTDSMAIKYCIPDAMKNNLNNVPSEYKEEVIRMLDEIITENKLN